MPLNVSIPSMGLRFINIYWFVLKELQDIYSALAR
jgi:hypothetical protein